MLVGPDGAILRSTTRTHAVDRPRPGHVEMDARVWWDELVDVVTELTADLAPVPSAAPTSRPTSRSPPSGSPAWARACC